MEVLEVDSAAFDKNFPNKKYVFNGADFNALNKDKAGEVKYLMVQNKNKALLGLIGGVSDHKFSSPFSAPFGGWSYNGDINLQELEEAHVLIEKHLIPQGISTIKMGIPPLFYDESALSLIFNAAIRCSFVIANVDLNFQFRLENFNADYLSFMSYNANKNYRIAERSNLYMEKMTTPHGIKAAYDVIAKNRSERGFPLKMTFENISDTIKVVPADFFMIFNKETMPVAAAVVFHVNKEVAQVVYWGHIGEFSSLKPINYLSYHIFDHYKNARFKFVDIGPSTENSTPNYGLVEFKQSIGCGISPKLTFEKKLN